MVHFDMPRKLRVQYPGAMYHVMSRGERRQRIFLDDVDRQDSIKTLAQACQNTGWQVHAYCLMANHYHVVMETPEPNLVAPEHRPGWIRVDRLPGEHGIQADTAAGRQEFEQHMERRRWEETKPEALAALRRG